ncbi:dethiobiotin synthase [Sulfurospirillum barnesii]|uniref:ATP-dependent dethiobiotin synthetase BioD n=1 Tax=Sulfurospirillum barnesii (strain ATCC 700032 / DSM 10660 / SES-3) TaxID=760154 RepID=I3XYH1_SULBS|nr:dethiobiotin synthase [Sulfurospirillum barnesii]AFL68995.1 dethiobiotin synthase [Sulfurospirillum barnesii SES-3]
MKYSPIFITATNTNVGKTYTTLKLLEALSAKGLKVGVMKPIETGVMDAPLDAVMLFEMAKRYHPDLEKLSLKEIVPYCFELPAAPFVAKGRKKINVDVLQHAYEKIASLCDIVLIEGAGGLLVPIEEDLYMYDFIRLFEAKTLLVGHDQLGCINDILLNLHLLDSLGVEDYEWCINFKAERTHFDTISLPFLKKTFGRVLSVQEDMPNILRSLGV